MYQKIVSCHIRPIEVKKSPSKISPLNTILLFLVRTALEKYKTEEVLMLNILAQLNTPSQKNQWKEKLVKIFDSINLQDDKPLFKTEKYELLETQYRNMGFL